jgi:hypothetical protein
MQREQFRNPFSPLFFNGHHLALIPLIISSLSQWPNKIRGQKIILVGAQT